MAAAHLGDQFDSAAVAEIPAEDFYDFAATRPNVVLRGNDREIEWPNPQIDIARLDDADRDLVLLQGYEPQLRWPSFVNAVVELAQTLDVSLAIGLGALIADVAHSRPASIIGSSEDDDLIDEFNLVTSNYEGPTGIIGVLTTGLQQAGIPTLSIWGSVPSYVPHAASPKVALALIDQLSGYLRVPVLGGDLIEEAAEYEQHIDSLVEQDDDTRAYVAVLEAQYDESLQTVSPDDMIEQLENFLRDQ